MATVEFDTDGAAEIRKLLDEAKGNLLVLCEEKGGSYNYMALSENDPIRKALNALELVSVAFAETEDEEDEVEE